MELIAYLRIGAGRLKRSSVETERQRARVGELAARLEAPVVAEFVELERGRRRDRPELALALAEARRRGAAIVVASLHRIARDAELLQHLSREAEDPALAGIRFCDLPEVEGSGAEGRIALRLLAAVAGFESRRISERTRESMAAARARGVRFGGIRPGQEQARTLRREQAREAAETCRAVVAPLVEGGLSLRQIGSALESAGHATPGGRSEWSPIQVARLLRRLGLGGSREPGAGGARSGRRQRPWHGRGASAGGGRAADAPLEREGSEA